MTAGETMRREREKEKREKRKNPPLLPLRGILVAHLLYKAALDLLAAFGTGKTVWMIAMAQGL